MPLAARVCYDVAGLQFSFQTDKFQDIVDYTDGNLGPLLSALCGYCWFVKVSCPHTPTARPPISTSRTARVCVQHALACLRLAAAPSRVVAFYGSMATNCVVRCRMPACCGA